MGEINWKNKYEALKAKFMESVDQAFRLGYEQGAQEAAVDQVTQQQQQQADQMGQDGPNADSNGQEQNGEEAKGEQVPEDTTDPVSAHPGGSELDQHISELENMVNKSENINPADILALAGKIKVLRKGMKLEDDLKKSHHAISGIAKALHKPKFKISQQANNNLSTAAKKAVNMQETIVNDIMKAWDEESKNTGKDILSQLKAEGHIKD